MRKKLGTIWWQSNKRDDLTLWDYHGWSNCIYIYILYIHIYTYTYIYIHTHSISCVYIYEIFFYTNRFVYQGIHAHGYPTMGFCLRKRCSFINYVPSEHDDSPPSDARWAEGISRIHTERHESSKLALHSSGPSQHSNHIDVILHPPKKSSFPAKNMLTLHGAPSITGPYRASLWWAPVTGARLGELGVGSWEN